jgi:O-antigen/teichoic acid export membrane protein
MIATTVSFLVSLYLAYQGYGLWSLISVQGIAVLVSSITQWGISGWWFTWTIDKKVIKEIAVFSSVIWIAGLFAFIMLQFDDFLVGQFAGLTMLGFYAKAYSLAKQPLGLFSQVANKVAGPAIAAVSDQPEKLTRGFNLVTGLVFKGTLLFGVILFLWAPELIQALIGDTWLPSVPLLRGLVLYLIVQPIWDLMSSLFTYTNRTKIYVYGQISQAILLLTVGTFAVMWQGAIGAAVIVSAIISVTTLFYLVAFVRKVVDIHWLDTFVYPLFAALFAAVGSSWIINNFFDSGLLFWVFIFVIPGIMYVSGLLVLQSQILRRDMNFLLEVLKRKE